MVRFVPIFLFILAFVGCEQPKNAVVPSPVTYTAKDVSKALADAQEFNREGKYEEALERHVWYHENALRYDPAQAGVRLSFALMDWVELTQKYPRSLDALKQERDKAEAIYHKDPSDRLQYEDAMSIDFAINDLAAAKTLFYEGRKNGISTPMLMNDDKIFESGDLKWAKDALGDPMEALDTFAMMRTAGQTPEMKKELDSSYIKMAVKLIKEVAQVDGSDVAKKVQHKALQQLDSPEIRSALN